MNKILLFLLLFLLCGCGKTTTITPSKCYLGKCIDIRVIPTSFNESPKIQVETDKGFYIIYGYHSYKRGEEILVECNYIYK